MALFAAKQRKITNIISPFYFVSTARLFHQAFVSFRKYVLEMTALPAELHIILNDVCYGAGL